MCSKYARVTEYVCYFYMFDRFLKMSWVLNMRGFWIWHGCEYASVIQSAEYDWICLTVMTIMSEHGWISPNVTEYSWKSRNKPSEAATRGVL